MLAKKVAIRRFLESEPRPQPRRAQNQGRRYIVWAQQYDDHRKETGG